MKGNEKKKANTVVTVKYVKIYEKYSVAFETLAGFTTNSYELSDSNGETLVTYKEEYKGKNGKDSLGIFGGLMEPRGKKILDKLFDQMEAYLKNIHIIFEDVDGFKRETISFSKFICAINNVLVRGVYKK